MGKNAADFVIRVAGRRYFVATVGSSPLFSRRTYFAARFIGESEARKYVLGNIVMFCSCIDAIRIVRMVPSKAAP